MANWDVLDRLDRSSQDTLLLLPLGLDERSLKLEVWLWAWLRGSGGDFVIKSFER